MKKQILSIMVVFLMFFIVMSACSRNDQVIDWETHSSILIQLDGSAKLKRKGWDKYIGVSFGTELGKEDRIQLDKNAYALVLCNDLSTWIVPHNTFSAPANGCPEIKQKNISDRNTVTTRGGINPAIPYIISPRATKLITAPSILRWNAVKGAKNYIVRVRGSNYYWEAESQDTHVMFTEGANLISGKTYILNIEADNGAVSLDEGVPGLGFSILSEDEAKPILNYVDAVNNLEISKEAKTYAIALMYFQNGLFDESINSLNKIDAFSSNFSSVYLLLGKEYHSISLLQKAEDTYREAIKLAEVEGNIEIKALAEENLGLVCKQMGKLAEGDNWLQAARKDFMSFGDSISVNRIDEY